MGYSDKLKDKKWKRKRLRILIRDRHTCQMCGYIGQFVQVHHKKYTGDPWDAPDEDLITLCKHCHETVHKPMLILRRLDRMQIGHIMKQMLT